MLKMQNDKGFTIIELLVVIVVVAILAAVSVVAYSGVQSRAENTKTVTAVEKYIKGLKLYATKEGKYPAPYFTWMCLGKQTSTCGVTPDSACWGVTSVTGDATFVSNLNTFMGSQPEVSTQATACSATGKASGAFYYSADGTNAGVYYFLRGDVGCGTPGGASNTRAQSVDTTFCGVTLTL
ncbi:MAG TPA: prepilin-type N-terminal cleavage/methylation domain-containing protein [Candidatus Saccharimonadales bacterium]